MLSGHGVVYAADATLYQRPEALNRVRVDIPTYVDLGRVVDAVVEISRRAKRVVNLVFVGEDHGRGKYAARDMRHDGCSLHVRHGHGDHAPLRSTMPNTGVLSTPRPLTLRRYPPM